jgi:DnaK suppressor protein
MEAPDVLLAAHRAEVTARLQSLTRTFDDVVASIEGESNDDEHDPDGSTIAFERAQVIALRDAAEAQLRALDGAIERLASGTYGRCEICARTIPDERLEALPATTTCVSCAER